MSNLEEIIKEEGKQLLTALLSISLEELKTKDDINYWAEGIEEYQKELKEMFTKNLYASEIYNQNEKLLCFFNQLKKEFEGIILKKNDSRKNE